jgi:hypothetical protein
VIDIDGFHEDGWCGQLLRIRAAALRPANRVTVSVWTTEDARLNLVSFTLQLDNGGDAKLFTTSPGEALELTGYRSLQAGEEFELRIFCGRRMSNAGSDSRALSFILKEICLE